MRITGYENNTAILQEIGLRLKKLRLDLNLTQAQMSARTGVSLSTINRMEQGEDVKVSNVINLLRELQLLSKLEILIPENEMRPTDYLDKKPQKKRASHRKKEPPKRQPWGDEVDS